jgi:hypothetical protein
MLCGWLLQNLFRFLGDFAHLFSFFILFFKIYQTKQVGGADGSHTQTAAGNHADGPAAIMRAN